MKGPATGPPFDLCFFLNSWQTAAGGLPQCSKSRAKKCIYVKLALRQSCLPSFEGGMLRSEGHAGLESSRRAVRFDEAGQARCDKHPSWNER